MTRQCFRISVSVLVWSCVSRPRHDLTTDETYHFTVSVSSAKTALVLCFETKTWPDDWRDSVLVWSCVSRPRHDLTTDETYHSSMTWRLTRLGLGLVLCFETKTWPDDWRDVSLYCLGLGLVLCFETKTWPDDWRGVSLKIHCHYQLVGVTCNDFVTSFLVTSVV